MKSLLLLALCLSGCGGQVADEDPVERFVRAVCACGNGWEGCPANVRSEAQYANPSCLLIQAEAYEKSCSPHPFPSCSWANP